MEQADACFRPTNFWDSGFSTIVDDLRKEGFARFREQPSARRFYVPTYENSAWRKRLERLRPAIAIADKLRPQSLIASRLDRWSSGEAAAFLDYRLFRAADTPGGLPIDKVSESETGGGERFSFEGMRVSLSFLNYLRGLAFLKKHIDTERLASFMEIGGGYGTLGEILLKAKPEAFYINVDIPPVAAVSTYYLQQILGAERVFTYLDAEDGAIDLEGLKGKYRAAVICPWQLPRLRGGVDAFVNFISFQEMEPPVVANYAKIVQQHTSQVVLLRNSAAGKNVGRPGEVGVIQPTTTDEMVAFFDEFHLLGRDSLGCGFQSLDGPFRSEVLCLGRNIT